MLSFLPKFKKIVLYGFAVLGGVALLWFVWQVVSGLSGGPSYRNTHDEYGGSYGAPTALSSPSFGFSNPFAREAPSADVARSAKEQSAAEGVLTQRKVVKNGSLSLLVEDAEETARSIQGLAESFGGFVQNSQVYEVSADVKAGSVTVRVPADKFSAALGEIKKLAKKVERENINADDVTEQFIDLEAQLKNMRAQETQLLDIMKRAYTVEDILSVANQLSSVRGSIERMEGQLQYLSRQVDMSSISVNLTAEADVEVFGIRWRPLFVVKQSFRNLLSGLTGYIDGIIRFLFNLPVYLLWIATVGAILLAAWKALRWVKRRFFSNPPA